MVVEMECTYCGHKWEMRPRSNNEIQDAICVKCGDSTLKVRDASKSAIDYYQGSPPFPVSADLYEVNYDDYGSTD